MSSFLSQVDFRFCKAGRFHSILLGYFLPIFHPESRAQFFPSQDHYFTSSVSLLGPAIRSPESFLVIVKEFILSTILQDGFALVNIQVGRRSTCAPNTACSGRVGTRRQKSVVHALSFFRFDGDSHPTHPPLTPAVSPHSEIIKLHHR